MSLCGCQHLYMHTTWLADKWHTWWTNLYWSFVWTIPGRSWRSVETILSTSIFESPCKMPWIPMSRASRVPVRPTPAEQWTMAGPLPSAILTSLKKWKILHKNQQSIKYIKTGTGIQPLFYCRDIRLSYNLLYVYNRRKHFHINIQAVYNYTLGSLVLV